MKSLIALLAISLSFAGQAKTLVISDIDDTIKATNVLSKTQVIINGLFSTKAFAGMSDLYQELNINSDTRIEYVSGAPNITKELAERFLAKNEFPQQDNLTLKKGSISTYDHKVAAIRKILLKENPDKIILLGDDTEADPEVYDTIAKENPNTVKSIYIHTVQDRKLPDNALIQTFFSAVEIAGAEVLKGTINITALTRVTDAFLVQEHNSKVVINGRYCPKEGRESLVQLKKQFTDAEALKDLDLAQEKIIETCK
jgi:phosphatidate phosphatase APP1